MLGIGMFSWFSYDLPIQERLQLIKSAGFDATGLWWSGDDKNNQPDMTRKIGLKIDNIHTPFNNPHQLWLDGIDGEDYKNMLISCVEDCKIHDISVAVIHLTSFKENVGVSDIGLKRIGKIIDIAEKMNIKLAFENIKTLEHLSAVFETFSSPNIGFCYDSGHENFMHPNEDCLNLYGDKLIALHINDNFGDGDTHVLPFDGTIDWQDKMRKLKQCKDVDYFTLEVDWNRNHEKCVIYHNLSAKDYLELAYKKSVQLLEL
ncbi:MAG: sugar phosphate isomerase/epimerase [Defluviitaleaceae bacterium]|nr:sugar phosphate isomerase/epimerase [Defluviitaleaceae bacterium]